MNSGSVFAAVEGSMTELLQLARSLFSIQERVKLLKLVASEDQVLLASCVVYEEVSFFLEYVPICC